MDPLIAVEDILGGVESWPTYIIYNMFLVEPNTISVKKVAAFMYGSGVPAECVIDFLMLVRDWTVIMIRCYE